MFSVPFFSALVFVAVRIQGENSQDLTGVDKTDDVSLFYSQSHTQYRRDSAALNKTLLEYEPVSASLLVRIDNLSKSVFGILTCFAKSSV